MQQRGTFPHPALPMYFSHDMKGPAPWENNSGSVILSFLANSAESANKRVPVNAKGRRREENGHLSNYIWSDPTLISQRPVNSQLAIAFDFCQTGLDLNG